MNTTIDVRRAASRFRTRTAWLDSYHSFSFGGHHDPDNTGHGLLLVSNDDRYSRTPASARTPAATWRSCRGS